jgi:hypothetical protein
MRITPIAFALCACLTTTTTTTDSSTTTPFGLGVTGAWTGTCSGKYLSAPLALNADLDLNEADGSVTGEAEIEAALGATGTTTTVSAELTGNRTGNTVALDAESSTATEQPWEAFSFELILVGDGLSGDLILPTDGDAVHVPCVLAR